MFLFIWFAVSLVVCQRVTLKKGQTLNLSCPVTNAHKTNVDWKNPDGYIMFFNRNQGEDHILCASITQQQYKQQHNLFDVRAKIARLLT